MNSKAGFIKERKLAPGFFCDCGKEAGMDCSVKMSVVVQSPAKLNLFLAITGRRPDGFHDLVSVVAPLEFGDELRAESSSAASGFSLECDDPRVPVDGSNLILRAAEAFASRTGWNRGVHFKLTKRIPMGAGLGGGSSNGVAALRALNQLANNLAEEGVLRGIAASLGSDCPLFLVAKPAIMRGRGERVECLAEPATKRIGGRRVLVFKPSFAINTAWAYAQMIRRGNDYLQESQAELSVARWLEGNARLEELLFNNMEGAAFEKYIALPVLLGNLQKRFGVVARMSGSGSACFALIDERHDEAALVDFIREAWGGAAFVVSTRLA